MALRPGRLDPFALWVVWLLRKSFFPLFVLGVIVAVVVARGDGGQTDIDVGSPLELLALLLTPWAGVALALLVRILANVLAVVLAVRLTGEATPRSYDGAVVTRWLRATADRVRLARVYRELRWTWSVRARAAQRLGASGGRLQTVDRALTFATTALVVALVVRLAVVVIASAST